jgi:quercetin dioxygenase-like cupin family protein
MQDRRSFLAATAASLLPVGLVAQTPAAQAPAPRNAAELARHALSGPLEGFEIVLVELNSAPGQRSKGPGHRHPGPVLGYVLEGQMIFGVNNGPEQAIPTGRTFFEPTGTLHSAGGSASADAPARAIVFMLVPKGAPLASPA